MATVEHWIFEVNLGVLIDELAELAGDDLDWGVRKVLMDDVAASDTDAAEPRWAEHTFAGKRTIVASLGIPAGSSVVDVRLEVDDDMRDRAVLLVSMLQRYSFKPL